MKILFVCRANVGRSQMAEALFNKLSKEHHADSSGTKVDENDGQKIGNNQKARFVWEVMDEERIDVRDNVRTQISEEMLDKYDKIIVMCAKDECPEYLLNNPKSEFWLMDDAKGTDYDFHVKTRNLIKNKVKDLLEEIEK